MKGPCVAIVNVLVGFIIAATACVAVPSAAVTSGTTFRETIVLLNPQRLESFLLYLVMNSRHEQMKWNVPLSIAYLDVDLRWVGQ